MQISLSLFLAKDPPQPHNIPVLYLNSQKSQQQEKPSDDDDYRVLKRLRSNSFDFIWWIITTIRI